MEKDIKDLFKEIKQTRQGLINLKKAYINYNEYITEQIDKSIDYTEYISQNLNREITYSQYVSEKIK